MFNPWISVAGVAGFLGVSTGAFGAHALKGSIDPYLLGVFETGSEYCLIHALALLGIGILAQNGTSKIVQRSGWLMTIGIFIFSGTLWTLALTNTRWLGAITPIGGLCLITGWLHLIWAGWVETKENQ